MKFKQYLVETKTNNFSVENAVAIAKECKSPIIAFDVATKNNIQDPELEQIIVKEHYLAFDYALHFGRFKLYEDILLQQNDASSILSYATKVIKGRWLEAESQLFNTSKPQHYAFVNMYLRDFPEARKPIKGPLILRGGMWYMHLWVITDIPNTISDEQVSKLLNLLCDSERIRAAVTDIPLYRIYYDKLADLIINEGQYKTTTISELRENEDILHEFKKTFYPPLDMDDSSDFD